MSVEPACFRQAQDTTESACVNLRALREGVKPVLISASNTIHAMTASESRPRRTFAEHLSLVEVFAFRVDALPPAAWQRLVERCRPLSGSTPSALLARAQLSATAFDVPDLPDPPAVVQVIAAGARAYIQTIFLGSELVTSAFPFTVEPPRTRRSTTGKPHADRYIDANNRLEAVLEREGVRVPGVATAVRAAAQALLSHDHLSAAVFSRAYGWMESEIPYAGLERGM